MPVAVDTNFVLNLAESEGDAWDAFEILQSRASELPVIVPPTVLDELAYISDREPSARLRRTARKALHSLVQTWHMHPAQLSPVQHGIVARVADALREAGLLPPEEKNDSYILVEAAVLNSILFVTADTHLRSIDFAQLTYHFRQFDLPALVIATPREIVGKFFR